MEPLAKKLFREANASVHESAARDKARVRQSIAMSLLEKGQLMGELGRSEMAIRLYDNLIARYAQAHEPARREHVAKALLAKGVELGKQGRSEEAIAVYDDLLARFADAPQRSIRVVVDEARKARS